MFLNILVILTFLQFASTQKRSPCPDVFTYEENSTDPDGWYGNIKLTTDTSLYGLWLRIVLDQPVDLLGNWFGETTTDDNKIFLVRNRNYELKSDRPLSVRVFIKYNSKNTIPVVKEIFLNGRRICVSNFSDSVATTTAPVKLYTTVTKTSQATTKAPEQSTSIRVGNDQCGTIKVSGHPLITFGEPTTEGEWPWHAAIYRNKGITFQYICGGSLISVKHILTTASCVTNPKSTQAFDADLFIVYLGKSTLSRVTPNAQNNGVKDIAVHPKYDPTYLYNNIAILHLDTPADITNFVRTVCLWGGDRSLNSIVGKFGTTVGWGYNQHAMLTENLMQATMPIVDTETCVHSNAEFFSIFSSPTTYCAGFRNGTSTCIGDSGGGMVFPIKVNGNTVWQLRGIVSLTAAAKTKIICDTANYVIFTDVAKHLDWIFSVMKN